MIFDYNFEIQFDMNEHSILHKKGYYLLNKDKIINKQLNKKNDEIDKKLKGVRVTKRKKDKLIKCMDAKRKKAEMKITDNIKKDNGVIYSNWRSGEISISKLKVGDKKNTWQLSIPALKANREYVFLIPKNLPENSINDLHELNFNLTLKNADYLNLEKKYNEILIEKIDKALVSNGNSMTIAKSFLNEQGYTLYDYNDYFKFYQEELKHFYDTIQFKFCDKNVSCSNIVDFMSHIHTEDIDTFINLSQCLIQFALTAKNDNIITAISQLKDIKSNELSKYLLTGRYPLSFVIDNPDIKNLNLTTYAQVEKNLKDTKSAITEIISFSRLSFVEFDSVSTINDSLSRVFDDKSKIIISKLNIINSNYEKAEKKIKENYKNLFLLKIITGTTLPEKNSDYLKNVIKADFGLQAFHGFNKNDDFYDRLLAHNFRPYVGFVYHPFVLNDNLPPKLSKWYKKGFIHFGLTLGSIEKNDGRKDLFNNNNLMVGLGYKINRFTHGSIGGIGYKNSSL